MNIKALSRRHGALGLGLLGLAASFSLPAYALGPWPGAGPVHFEQLQHSAHEMVIHPGAIDWLSQPLGLSLYGQSQVTFDEAIRLVLRDHLQSPLIATTAVDTTAKSLGLANGGQSIDYTFKINGTPLCGYQVRAHRLGDGSSLVLGTLPEVASGEVAPSPADWPDLELSADQAGRALRQQIGAAPLRLGHSERCLYVAQGKLMPVWKMNVYADQSPYIILADAYETLKLDQNFFDAVDGTARIYPRNILAGPAQTVNLHDLNADGTLTSTFLQTVVPSGTTQAKDATGHAFVYPDDDARFPEAQAYAHAATHFAWFQDIGFEWYGPKPLQLKIHVAPNGVPNNALFTPGDDSDGLLPMIQIDNGDGKILQNLVTDGDVVSHEMGHHIIYKTLTNTTKESLVLHEGLADTFVFLRTGDPCLGASICPVTSMACASQGKCLRTAGQNNVAYNDATWASWAGPQNVLGHKHGQLISGILWDLVKTQSMSSKDVTALTFKTISFFKANSGLCDFTAALYAADKALYQGANEAKLTSVLTTRGMTPFLPTTSPACASLDGASLGSNSGGGATSESKKKKSWTGCGVLGTVVHSSSEAYLALLLLLPLGLALRPKPAAQRARRSPPKPRRG